MRRFVCLLAITLAAFSSDSFLRAQQTNPVDRKVANPITDTPNVDPVSAENSIAAPKRKPAVAPEGGDDEIVVYSEKNTV